MKKLEKVVVLALSVLSMIAPAFAIKIGIDPVFADPRFLPANQFHAGCLSTANINFKSDGAKIENVHLVMDYNPKDIEIVNVISDSTDKNSVNYNIDTDKIILNYLNSDAKDLKDETLFKIDLKNLIGSSASSLDIGTGSYALTKNGKKIPLNANLDIVFGAAQECDPDLLPPMISLVYPSNVNDRVALDSYFIFNVKDLGKGVDTSSVKVDLGGKTYDGSSKNIQRSGDFMIFYPQEWLPLGTGIKVKLQVADLQSYGGANIIKKQFKFDTATGMLLMNNISPIDYRNIVAQAQEAKASDGECKVLANLYSLGTPQDQFMVKNISSKLACDPTALVVSAPNPSVVSADNPFQKTNGKTSVLTVVGWILFGIALMLKIHYYIAYRRHKGLLEAHIAEHHS